MALDSLSSAQIVAYQNFCNLDGVCTNQAVFEMEMLPARNHGKGSTNRDYGFVKSPKTKSAGTKHVGFGCEYEKNIAFQQDERGHCETIYDSRSAAISVATEKWSIDSVGLLADRIAQARKRIALMNDTPSELGDSCNDVKSDFPHRATHEEFTLNDAAQRHSAGEVISKQRDAALVNALYTGGRTSICDCKEGGSETSVPLADRVAAARRRIAKMKKASQQLNPVREIMFKPRSTSKPGDDLSLDGTASTCTFQGDSMYTSETAPSTLSKQSSYVAFPGHKLGLLPERNGLLRYESLSSHTTNGNVVEKRLALNLASNEDTNINIGPEVDTSSTGDVNASVVMNEQLRDSLVNDSLAPILNRRIQVSNVQSEEMKYGLTDSSIEMQSKSTMPAYPFPVTRTPAQAITAIRGSCEGATPPNKLACVAESTSNNTNRLTRHEVPQESLCLDSSDPEESQNSKKGQSNDSKCECPLREDPEYIKYYKMLKLGVPEGAVRNALQRDGKDPGIMDLDPNKSLNSQKDSRIDGPPLKDDAAKPAMKRDAKDGTILYVDSAKSLKTQGTQSEAKEGEYALREDPEYAKYFKMLKMGLPEGAVRNAIQGDGKDPVILDLDPAKSLRSQKEGGDKENDGPPLKDDPAYSKYYKMLKMGLPEGAVRNALQRDGKDPGILDLDPTKSLKSQKKGGDKEDDGPPLKDDPAYSKYYKMLKMGLPEGAVQQALQRDGKDPRILHLDPSKSLASQKRKETHLSPPKQPKKVVRRKKVHWTPINPAKVGENSIWSLVQGTVSMAELDYDASEFNNLFTETRKDVTTAPRKNSSGKEVLRRRKSVEVIDGKRGMNGGIILARIKLEYERLATVIDRMEPGSLDGTQLQALKEFLPSDDERKSLDLYMKKHVVNRTKKDPGWAALSECEKYMVNMIAVEDASKKIDCMVFRDQFESRSDDIVACRDCLGKACMEVRSSEKLRKMMALILTLVNHINSGGNGSTVVGFSLDALLKLNETKTFDKKTTVLQYLAKLVKQNDESLLDFKDEFSCLTSVNGIDIDSLVAEANKLRKELDMVHDTATKEADRLVGKQAPVKMTIEDLCQQRTSVRKIDGQTHINQMDHVTGRTPMERFTLQAKLSVAELSSSIDMLKSTYADLLAYFGENESMPSNEFFGTINKFAVEFGDAVDQVHKAEKKKLRDKLRAAAKVTALSKSLGKMAKARKGKSHSRLQVS